ncbi:unnamed protein product [Strongylus vulgaris]|uniref:Uncharacterized protein n=1 Tax=Strongylus vulgaris TaxID=40348 RepID=A0A3P7IMH8_STRVU|nr:unnamed protein product [Strongylus vulgaris]
MFSADIAYFSERNNTEQTASAVLSSAVLDESLSLESKPSFDDFAFTGESSSMSKDSLSPASSPSVLHPFVKSSWSNGSKVSTQLSEHVPSTMLDGELLESATAFGPTEVPLDCDHVCPNKYELGPEYCYRILSAKQSRTYLRALRSCQEDVNADLADEIDLRNPEVMELVRSLR